jgi:hypothetical protein
VAPGVHVGTLHTREIHTNGGIPAGTPDLIRGGVFVLAGANVDHVLTDGPVTTYGPNDMVLDNWGQVDTWTATAALISYGQSGIGLEVVRHDHTPVAGCARGHDVPAVHHILVGGGGAILQQHLVGAHALRYQVVGHRSRRRSRRKPTTTTHAFSRR